jgi:hypothetical protein
MFGGWGKVAAAAILGAFSRRKLQKLGRPGNEEVGLSGGAPVAGRGGWHWHGVSRSSGGAWAEEEERKEELIHRCSPLKAARGGGWWRRGGGNGEQETTAVKPWAWARRQRPLSEGGQRGLGAVRVVRLMIGPTQFCIFPELSKPAQTWNLKMDVLPSCINSQFLHVASLGYYEHFYQLCRHPIPNRNRAKNPETDSTFESLMNFKKGFNPSRKIW